MRFKQNMRAALSVLFAVVLGIASVLPLSAQSDDASDAPDFANKTFLPMVSTDRSIAQEGESNEAHVVDTVAATAEDFRSAEQMSSKPFAAYDPSVDHSAEANSEVSAAATDAVCLISGFSGYLAPFATVEIGAYSTTRCSYIDLQLDPVSTRVWVRVYYYKGGKIKFGKWYFISTSGVYRILKNPKAGSVFYVQFQNPYATTSYEQGVIRY